MLENNRSATCTALTASYLILPTKNSVRKLIGRPCLFLSLYFGDWPSDRFNNNKNYNCFESLIYNIVAQRTWLIWAVGGGGQGVSVFTFYESCRSPHFLLCQRCLKTDKRDRVWHIWNSIDMINLWFLCALLERRTVLLRRTFLWHQLQRYRKRFPNNQPKPAVR